MNFQHPTEIPEEPLVIFQNPEALELPRFSALARIGGTLSISSNEALTSIQGFSALKDLSGGLYIGENASLMRVEFANRLSVLGPVFIALNPRLHTVAGFDVLESVHGDFTVSNNESLEVLQVPYLVEVDGTLLLKDLPLLRVADFPRLRSVTKSWSMLRTRELTSLTGFSAIEHVGEVASFVENDELGELSLNGTLDSLTMLEIRGNPRLNRVRGTDSVHFAPLTSVVISGNPHLGAVEGFANVKALAGLALNENDVLKQISAWESLEEVVGESGLRITRNAALEGPLVLFPALRAAKDVWIFGNASLDPLIVTALLDRADSENAPRIGDNRGETTEFDPCPWSGDQVCDANFDSSGIRGTELCSSDSEDC